MSLVVLLLGTILALILRSRLSVERPGGFQQAAELLLTNPMGFGIKDLLEENVPTAQNRYHSVSRHNFHFRAALQPAQHFPGIFFAHGGTRTCLWPAPCSSFCISTGRESAIMVPSIIC